MAGDSQWYVLHTVFQSLCTSHQKGLGLGGGECSQKFHWEVEELYKHGSRAHHTF